MENNLTDMKAEVKKYLDSLPHSVQTAIIESGVKFNNLEQLKTVACEYMGKADS